MSAHRTMGLADVPSPARLWSAGRDELSAWVCRKDAEFAAESRAAAEEGDEPLDRAELLDLAAGMLMGGGQWGTAECRAWDAIVAGDGGSAWAERMANAAPGWTAEQHAHDLGVAAALDTYYGDDGELARTRSLADLASDAMLAARQDGIPEDLLRDYIVAYVGAVAWWIAEPAASRA